MKHCKEPQLTPCFNNGTCVLGTDNYEYCKFFIFIIIKEFFFLLISIIITGMCKPDFTGHNCEIMLKNAANQTIGRWNLLLNALLFFITLKTLLILL
jgi:hypothetical protein